jgi:hypothetical protein
MTWEQREEAFQSPRTSRGSCDAARKSGDPELAKLASAVSIPSDLTGVLRPRPGPPRCLRARHGPRFNPLGPHGGPATSLYNTASERLQAKFQSPRTSRGSCDSPVSGKSTWPRTRGVSIPSDLTGVLRPAAPKGGEPRVGNHPVSIPSDLTGVLRRQTCGGTGSNRIPVSIPSDLTGVLRRPDGAYLFDPARLPDGFNPLGPHGGPATLAFHDPHACGNLETGIGNPPPTSSRMNQHYHVRTARTASSSPSQRFGNLAMNTSFSTSAEVSDSGGLRRPTRRPEDSPARPGASRAVCRTEPPARAPLGGRPAVNGGGPPRPGPGAEGVLPQTRTPRPPKGAHPELPRPAARAAWRPSHRAPRPGAPQGAARRDRRGPSTPGARREGGARFGPPGLGGHHHPGGLSTAGGPGAGRGRGAAGCGGRPTGSRITRAPGPVKRAPAADGPRHGARGRVDLNGPWPEARRRTAARHTIDT